MKRATRDVTKFTVAQMDDAIRKSAMTDAEKSADWEERRIAAAFRQRHPEFKPSEHAGSLIANYVAAMGMETSLEAVETAYAALRKDGAL
jgi:hypothetical protein